MHRDSPIGSWYRVDTNEYPAFFSEFDRVANQIDQYLTNTKGVAVALFWKSGINVSHQKQALLRSPDAHHRDDFFEQFAR